MRITKIRPGALSVIPIVGTLSVPFPTALGSVDVELSGFALSLARGDVIELTLPSDFTAESPRCALLTRSGAAVVSGTTTQAQTNNSTMLLRFSLDVALFENSTNSTDLVLSCSGVRNPASVSSTPSPAVMTVRTSDGTSLISANLATNSTGLTSIAQASLCACNATLQLPLTNTVTTLATLLTVPVALIGPAYMLELVTPSELTLNSGAATTCVATYTNGTSIAGSTTVAVDTRTISFSATKAANGANSAAVKLSCAQVRTPRAATSNSTALSARIVHKSTGTIVGNAAAVALGPVSAATLGYYTRALIRSSNLPAAVGDITATLDSLYVSLRVSEALVFEVPNTYTISSGGATSCVLKHAGVNVTGSTTVSKRKRRIMFEPFTNLAVPTDSRRAVTVLSCNYISSPPNPEVARADVRVWTQTGAGNMIAYTESATLPAVAAPELALATGLVSLTSNPLLGTRLLVRASPLYWQYVEGSMLRVVLPSSHSLGTAPSCSATVHGLMVQPVRTATQSGTLYVRFQSALTTLPLIPTVLEVACTDVSGSVGAIAGATVQGLREDGLVEAHVVSTISSSGLLPIAALVPSTAESTLVFSETSSIVGGLSGGLDLISLFGDALGAILPSIVPGNMTTVATMLPASFMDDAGGLACTINGVAIETAAAVDGLLQLSVPAAAFDVSGALLKCVTADGEEPDFSTLDPWGVFIISANGTVTPIGSTSRAPYVRLIGGAYAAATHSNAVTSGTGELNMRIKAVNVTLDTEDLLVLHLPPELKLSSSESACKITHNGIRMSGAFTLVGSLLRFEPAEEMPHYVEPLRDVDYNDDGSRRATARDRKSTRLNPVTQ